MKYLSLAIIALSLTFGACAHQDNAPAGSSYSSTTSTGYSK